ncbi:MAG: polyribonucleotide nucleotidyltransferase [Candidatus Gracilibacteria bacterium]|jgi:polyribonucleotide nucleotidyltransferase|nr:polyribonucleotide nucleotidyltransferase [Candidatus Gracilibacteria bacterium]
MTFPEIKQYSLDLAGQTISVEFGRMANQTDGSCTVRCGDTVVLATAVISKNPPRDGVDFMPLMVNFQEKMFAAGKIKTNRFNKREGRPADDKILIGRLVDRSLRPLFPKYLRQDVQVMLMPLSYDGVNQHDTLCALAGSCALTVSQIPFDGPIATVRVGLIDDKFVLNPTTEQREVSDLDLVVSATKENVVMIEAGANQIPEEKMLEAIEFGKENGQKICEFFSKIREEIGQEKIVIPEPEVDEDLKKFIEDNFADEIEKCIFDYPGKLARFQRKAELSRMATEKAAEYFGEEYDVSTAGSLFDGVFKKKIRESVLIHEKRINGRKLNEIRPIKVEGTVLPRTHGSALFTRGETQGLTVCTLAGPATKLLTEGIEGEDKLRFFHYYTFPPFSVGECSNRLSAGNREIGHGALAQRAIEPVLPNDSDFPYTIQCNTEILSSNGSSSMAATCGTTLALMDAGVPIKAPVSGIAMGLMTDDEGNFKILSDIQDEEDFGGDMDFKVTGTEKGITAIQMDIKVKGLSKEIFEKALAQAKEGRMHILEKMLEVIKEPRKEMSIYAPRLISMQINPDKIRDVIGKGGEMINKIIDQTGVDINIEDTGEVVITGVDGKGAERAKAWIERIVFEPEIGKTYEAKVTRIENYGMFAEIAGSPQQGLVHISLIADRRIEDISKEFQIGHEIRVKVVDIDQQGRIRLSMKDASQD